MIGKNSASRKMKTLRKNMFNTKIKIERLEKQLSENNCWTSSYISWKEVWAFMTIKNISSVKAVYLFIVRRKEGFPQNFRVKISDMTFTPTQIPVVDYRLDTIIFHATINQ